MMVVCASKGSQHAAHLVAVHAGQADVEQDGIRKIVPGGVKGFPSIMDRFEFVADVFEQHAHRVSDNGIVVDDKNLQRSVSCCRLVGGWRF